MKPIAKDRLEAILTAMYAARTKDKILYFKADLNLPYAKMQDAVEIAPPCRRARPGGNHGPQGRAVGCSQGRGEVADGNVSGKYAAA